MRGGGCEPGRRHRCWGLTGHSLKNTHMKKNVIERCASRHQPTHTYICHPPVCLVGGAKRPLLMQKLAGACPTRCHGDEINIILFDWSPRFPALLFSRMCSAPISRLNTVKTFSAERIDSTQACRLSPYCTAQHFNTAASAETANRLQPLLSAHFNLRSVARFHAFNKTHEPQNAPKNSIFVNDL